MEELTPDEIIEILTKIRNVCKEHSCSNCPFVVYIGKEHSCRCGIGICKPSYWPITDNIPMFYAFSYNMNNAKDEGDD